MRLLLDTCTFLWLVDDHPSLSERARDAIVDPANEVYYLPRQREAHQIESLPIGEDATLALAKLPVPHRDPFDRILVAQAIIEGCSLVTPDPLIKAYPVPILW